MKRVITAMLLSWSVVGLVVAADKECGIPEIKPDLNELNIIGGKEAVPGSWPWQVGLYTKPKLNFPPYDRDFFFCAGALIDEQTVITAGHCLVKRIENVRIHLGSHLRSSKDDGQVNVNVKHYCSYPTYVAGNINDIGIIRLEKAVNFSKTISPICLPEKDDEVRIDDDEVYVTGWGYTSDDWDRVQSEELKQAKLRIITKEECFAMREMNVDRTICSKHDLGSSCHGDSGGPLVLERDGRWQLQGVVSGGPRECGDVDWPMYYTEVAKYRDWIDQYRSSADPLHTRGLCKEGLQ